MSTQRIKHLSEFANESDFVGWAYSPTVSGEAGGIGWRVRPPYGLRTGCFRLAKFVGVIGIAAAFCAGWAYADGPTTRPARARIVHFIPNVDSAPSNLGTATSRSPTTDPLLAASVVAPQTTEGLTTQESPSLFWYTTKPTDSRIEVVLVKADDLKDVKPLVKLVFRDPLTSGLQRLDLAKAGVKLDVNVRYKWSVSLIDPEGRSGDIVSQAIIRRVAAPEKLTTALAHATDESEKAAIYGEAGFWYDTLGAISNRIDSNPSDVQVRQLRSNLLDQAGLPVLPKELKNWASGAAGK